LPGRLPQEELIAVGDAHKVVVPRGLEVQAPEPNFESGWEGVRASHGDLWDLYSVRITIEISGGKLIFSVPLPGAPTVGVESSPDTN
jgi:hypothetical protein